MVNHFISGRALQARFSHSFYSCLYSLMHHIFIKCLLVVGIILGDRAVKKSRQHPGSHQTYISVGHHNKYLSIGDITKRKNEPSKGLKSELETWRSSLS